MKNSNDTIGNRTRNLSSCSALPQLFLNVCTGRSLTDSDDTRCYINTISHPEDEQDIARNMYM